MPRNKSQKHWGRYRLDDETADILAVILAIRRLKQKDAYIVIREALSALPEYADALKILRRFDASNGETPPPDTDNSE